MSDLQPHNNDNDTPVNDHPLSQKPKPEYDGKPKNSNHPLYGGNHDDDKPKNTAPPPQRAIIVQKTHQPILTYILVATNIAIFFYANLLMSGTDLAISNDMVRDFSAFPPAILQNLELHRLFTAMFLHGNLMHILFNMYALYIIGTNVERTFGTLRFGLIYFLGGLAGSIASVVFGDYYVPSIGASGAVFAVWAAEAIHVYRHRVLYAGIARRVLLNTGIFLGLNLLLGFTNPQIDNWGHIGGFIGGGILTYLIGPIYRLVREISPTGQMQARVVDDNPLDKTQLKLGIYITGLIIILAGAVLFITPPA